MWLEIDLEPEEQLIRVSARGSRGERPAQHRLSPEKGTFNRQTFTNKVARAARFGKGLEADLLGYAHALHQDLLQGELRDVFDGCGQHVGRYWCRHCRGSEDAAHGERRSILAGAVPSGIGLRAFQFQESEGGSAG